MKLLVLTLLISSYICHYLKKTKSLPDAPYEEYHSKNLAFREDMEIGQITLKTPLLRNNVYETWEVYSYKNKLKVLYFAHIFKYSLSGQFPVLSANIKQFCERIEKYNANMKKENIAFSAFKCLDGNIQVGKYQEYDVYYFLINRGSIMLSLNEICLPNCQKETLCKYSLRRFSKGIVKARMVNLEDTNLYGFRFILKTNTIYYGLPQDLKLAAAQAKNIKLEDSVKEFIGIPFFYFEDLSFFNKQQRALNITPLKTKLAEVGIFIQSMYKSPNSKYIFRDYQDKIDVYRKLNKKECPVSQNEDEYFGICKEFLEKSGPVLSQLTKENHLIENLNKMLEGSFYEFIYKLVHWEKPSEKNQIFTSWQDAYNHQFIRESKNYKAISDSH